MSPWIAWTAEAFSRATNELLRDPAKAALRGEALQTKARLHLSPEACYEPVATMLRALTSEGATPP